MTDDQIALIEASFRQVTPIAEPAAALFYRRLFELDPALRPMFAQTDLAAQGRKLMAAIGFVVANLRRPEAMLPAVRALGARHGGYGVQPAHYDTVGVALLDTLALGLGDGFTPATRDAWACAFGILARTMIAATEPQQQAA